MTNNNLTDERLSALIRVARDSLELYEMELPVIDDVMLALAELQQRRAAMLQGADNEIQRKAEIHDALCGKYNVESLADFVDWQRNHIAELEAAPPAPVGPGETAVMPDYPGYMMTQRECFQAGKKAGLAEAGNSPVIPDGWVACSERMPEEGSKVIVFRPRASESNDPPVKTATYKGGREYYHGFDCYCEPTHWMPMPAAPLQEVK
ncbi:TPA: DUF551 domain-containing protein [Enterobacter roggenkampii]